MVSKHWIPGNPFKTRTIAVSRWLVEQFKIDDDDIPIGEIPEGLAYDQSVQYDVGLFWTHRSGQVRVEFEAASGQSNWWSTINVYDEEGDMIEQSEPGEFLLGIHDYLLSDGTQVEFEVVQE